MTLRRLAASTLGSNAASTSALAGYRLTAESAAIYAPNGRTSDVAEAREGRSGALRAWTTINPGGIHEGVHPRTCGIRTSAYISDKDLFAEFYRNQLSKRRGGGILCILLSANGKPIV